MYKYTVTASATDWCGYEETIEVTSLTPIYEEELMDKAEKHLADFYDLLDSGTGEGYGELSDFDEDGDPLPDAELTGITCHVEEERVCSTEHITSLKSAEDVLEYLLELPLYKKLELNDSLVPVEVLAVNTACGTVMSLPTGSLDLTKENSLEDMIKAMKETLSA